MFICPHCKTALVRKSGPNGVFWGCDRCGGRAVGVGPLRKNFGPQVTTEIWAQAVRDDARPGRPCPICSRHMVEATLNVSGKSLAIDICRRCEFVWFDTSEYESIPLAPPKPRELGDIDEKSLPQEVREKLALMKVQQMREQAQATNPEPDREWKYIPAMLGLPVEMESSPLQQIPWATYLFAAGITVVSVAAFFNLSHTISQYGLIPAQAMRDGGFTFITSFFLHVGIFHLVTNLYFLLIFGPPVENYLGRLRWVALVVLATFTGDFFHLMIDPRVDLPSIGASGGISGIIAFYAFKFPHARLGIMFRYFYIFRLIPIPAWSAFLLWIVIQVWGTYAQIAGFGHVSSLAHLGGVAIGILFWAIWKNLDSQPTSGSLPIKIS